MPFTDALLPEFDHEMGTTRRLLERVPDDHLGWKPHDRSMTLGRLATHLAEIPQWSEQMLDHDEMNLTGAYQPRQEQSRAAILALFDAATTQARKCLASKSDAELMAPWSFKREGKTLFSMPKVAVVRSMLLNHMVHHRGQLSVYLRLKDVPLPAMYGPSADEGAF
jgi:uncharacterized damage-inducible protein DinB